MLNKLILKIVRDDMINIKGFDSNVLKIDKKSYKDIGIYNTGYITMKMLVIMIILINPLYLYMMYL